MTTEELKARLKKIQADILEATQAEDTAELPALVASRKPYLELVASRAAVDPELRTWGKAYLKADETLLARAIERQNQVGQELQSNRHRTTAHKAYLRGQTLG
jgi:hypothetical protein